MAKDMDFNYEMKKDGIDAVIDDLGSNSFIAVREIRWNEDSPFRVDIRKYFTKADGTEGAGKGISFPSPESVSKLTESLVEHGYGDSKKLAKTVVARDDGLMALATALTAYNDREFGTMLEDLTVARKEAVNEDSKKQNATDMLNDLLKE